MNPSTPSRRTQVYRLLRNECGFTHHQARHLIMRHLSNLGDFRNIFYKGLKADREVWLEAAQPIASLSLRDDALEAGRSILNQCWPSYRLTGATGPGPEMPFTCASFAARMVKEIQGFNPTQGRILWSQIELILRREERDAEAAWIDRMIPTYLKVKGVL